MDSAFQKNLLSALRVPQRQILEVSRALTFSLTLSLTYSPNYPRVSHSFTRSCSLILHSSRSGSPHPCVFTQFFTHLTHFAVTFLYNTHSFTHSARSILTHLRTGRYLILSGWFPPPDIKSPQVRHSTHTCTRTHIHTQMGVSL